MTCLRLLRLDIVATVGVTQHSTHQGGYCAEPGCARLRVSGGGQVHLPSALIRRLRAVRAWVQVQVQAWA